MTDLTEYLQMKQYHQNYLRPSNHLQKINRRLSTSLPRHSSITAESYIQCNHNNASGFGTWRRLHITHDQGEKAQHLAQLARIMKPVWNNTTQPPNEFIKTFQNWRDEIYNYEQSVSELPS
eukprot:1931781-Amphidinium_carterae.1